MSEFLSFLPAFGVAFTLLIIGGASPGPAVAMVMGLAFDQGRRPAVQLCIGIAAGSATINVLTILGVGLLLSHIAGAMTVLKFAGAAYLLWLAWGAFGKAVHPPKLSRASMARYGAGRLFAMGYLLQVLNPKAIAFWLAIAAAAPIASAPYWVIALYVIACAGVSFSTHASWAVALSSAPVRSAYSRARRWVEAGLGCFFVFASFKLATARV